MNFVDSAGRVLPLLALAGLAAPTARADEVADWNAKACEIVSATTPRPPIANRALAIVQTAVYGAVNAITRRDPDDGLHLQAGRDASVAAAIAAANHVALLQLAPAQQPAIEVAYRDALAKIVDGPAKSAGIAVGENAARAVLVAHENDGAAAAEAYRPYTVAGVYVPTAIQAVPQWAQRKPWLMASAAQFRPDPPPALDSALWTRDFNESKAIGGRNSMQRDAEQTTVAKFWEATMPPIYYGVARSLAMQPGRDITRNARLYAAVAQAMDDALIAVFEAKYHYGFWRPVTAIRNGDIDGNDATARDPSWAPFIDTPMHPEYPCAHCVVSSAVGTVLKADIGAGPTPTLTTTSPTADNAARSWSTVDAFVAEVSEARICDGVHYRNSTEVGKAMGVQVGTLAARKFLHSRE